MDAFPNKEAVQVAAQKEGKSVTEYIMEAVRLRMEQDPVEWDRCPISPDRIKS